ncbi:DUF3800 domain-containing protein [Cetobacterium sp.]|uniref:DUF3800 domain-containing protein n=1 Tax=Cetobacterium sp. TaxID=2071632 RepID=UPI003F35FC31
MLKKYKIFCDESNHLYSDKSNLMIIGGIFCPNDEVQEVNKYIKYLKHKYNAKSELKWTKLNSNKKDFYRELLEYFFSRINLSFNAQIVMNKSNLNHDIYNHGESDEFYYKMYYYTLLPFLKENNDYNIFIDYKDTRGGQRAKKLKNIINNKFYSNINVDFTIIHSQESQIMQLTDLLIGAIGYKNRSDIEKNSVIKNYIVDLLEEKSDFYLDSSTPEWEKKFRFYKFYPRTHGGIF